MPLAPSQLPMAKVATSAAAPPITTRTAAFVFEPPPIQAPMAPVRASATSTATNVSGTRMFSGGSRMASMGRIAPARKAAAEANAACHGLTMSVSSMLQLRGKVGAEGVVRGEFPGHGPGGVRAEALALVDRGEFLELLLGLFGQLPAFLFDQRLLAVLLAADGHVFAQGHGDGAAHHAGGAGDEDGSGVRGDAGDAHHNRGDGDDAVVGAQHARAQPVQAVRDVVVVGLVLMLDGGGLAVHAYSKAPAPAAGQHDEPK